MPSASDDRLQQWQSNRAARLDALPWLHTDNTTGRPVRFVAGELLVASDHEGPARDALSKQGQSGRAVTGDQVAPGLTRLRASGMDVAAATRSVRGSHRDALVGPNHVFLSSPFEIGGPFGPPAVPNNPWSLPAGPSASASVRVAVVDTGIWRATPLPPSWYEATDDDYDDTLDDDADIGHANFITGVIMASTSNARVRIVKVLDASGLCTEAELAKALLTLPDVDVVNLSLGGFSVDGQPPAILAFALGRLLDDADRVVVAAAGNDGDAKNPFWPAAFAGTKTPWAGQVIAVAAHDGSEVCSWSNTGPWISMAAPGSDIVSTYVTHGEFTDGLALWSGTSFAAPRVVAAIAESHATAGTIADAVTQVRTAAESRSYGPYPGLA
ncbi:MAG TPA: S8/S53 family peptidase [Micromonosporaceae bacterium]|nr:S8/S53 family peptidase [Micromonosporaceae bacterium]